MLVSLAMTGFLLIVMPGLLYGTAYLAKRYTEDRPIRLKSAAQKSGKARSRPIYGEFTGKRGRPLYAERS